MYTCNHFTNPYSEEVEPTLAIPIKAISLLLLQHLNKYTKRFLFFSKKRLTFLYETNIINIVLKEII